jgi:uncharacterized damage-inducible protein DinB
MRYKKDIHMTPDEARLHLRYSGWASRKLVDAAQELSPEARTRPLGVSHESLQRTLGHIYFADGIWYTRLVDAASPVPSHTELHPMEALTGDWRDLQKRWEAWADALTGDDLERLVEYKSIFGGQAQTPAWQIVMHVVNHATLHRGQVVAMMRQLGAKPPATDLMFYYRELSGR